METLSPDDMLMLKGLCVLGGFILLIILGMMAVGMGRDN